MLYLCTALLLSFRTALLLYLYVALLLLFRYSFIALFMCTFIAPWHWHFIPLWLLKHAHLVWTKSRLVWCHTNFISKNQKDFCIEKEFERYKIKAPWLFHIFTLHISQCMSNVSQGPDRKCDIDENSQLNICNSVLWKEASGKFANQ